MTSRARLLCIFNCLINFHFILTLFVVFPEERWSGDACFTRAFFTGVLEAKASLQEKRILQCVYNQIGAFWVSPIVRDLGSTPARVNVLQDRVLFNSLSVIDFYERELCFNCLRDFRIFLFWVLFVIFSSFSSEKVLSEIFPLRFLTLSYKIF